MRIVHFGASNSSRSINQKLAANAAKLIDFQQVIGLDLNDYEMPIYSIDREEKDGIPEEALRFSEQIKLADGIIISFAEHNGSYSVAFKNIFDWTSRLKPSPWQDKTLLLLSTSPGVRGGVDALSIAVNRFPYMGMKVAGHFSLPSFGENFSIEHGITDRELKRKFMAQVDRFSEMVKVNQSAQTGE